MQTEISKSKFKARALEIFRRIEKTGTPVVITDNGTPTLIVKRYSPDETDVRKRLKGSVLRYDQPLAPVAEDWDADA
ncbi:MAG: hypothetical protein ACREPU_00775 [Rhodanobacteraceae bacterium]